jgi:HAD superfamily hydrolase (TIGR01484 family)
LKISAIFSDYDGTLAPEDVALDASSVPKEIEEPLLGLSSSVSVAIVTSKDYAFVRPRTPFAAAWACVSGLEIVLSDGRTLATSRMADKLREGLNYVKRHNQSGLELELKRSTANDLLAFSVHWRGKSPPTELIAKATAKLSGIGLTVVHDPAQPFLDVFGGRPDKGRAVRELKTLLGVSGNVLFIGDSAADNAAFEEADVSICVDHGQGLDDVRCRYTLGRERLGPFLSSLSANGLSLDLHTLSRL